MAAPPGKDELLDSYLSEVQSLESAMSVDLPEEFHGQRCTKFGCAVWWAVVSFEQYENESIPRDDECFIPEAHEENAFREAAAYLLNEARVREPVTEYDLRSLWHEARNYRRPASRPPDMAARAATRLALVHILPRRYRGITRSEVYGAVALGETFVEVAHDEKVAETALELLACAKNLQAVEGGVEKAIEEAREILMTLNTRSAFARACATIGRYANHHRPKPRRLARARTIENLWSKHRHRLPE